MDINWSKSPEDATHYAPAFGKADQLWAKKIGDYWHYCSIDNFEGRGWYAGVGPDSRESYIERPSALKMNEAEKQVVMMLAQVWNKYLELTNEHISDNIEFCAGIHRLQEKVLARPARRELNK